MRGKRRNVRDARAHTDTQAAGPSLAPLTYFTLLHPPPHQSSFGSTPNVYIPAHCANTLTHTHTYAFRQVGWRAAAVTRPSHCAFSCRSLFPLLRPRKKSGGCMQTSAVLRRRSHSLPSLSREKKTHTQNEFCMMQQHPGKKKKKKGLEKTGMRRCGGGEAAAMCPFCRKNKSSSGDKIEDVLR